MDSKGEKSKENDASSDRKRPAQEPAQQPTKKVPKRHQPLVATPTTVAEPVETMISPNINSPGNGSKNTPCSTKDACTATATNVVTNDTMLAKKVAFQSPSPHIHQFAVEKAPEHTVTDLLENPKAPTQNSATDNKAPPINEATKKTVHGTATAVTATNQTTPVTAINPAWGSNSLPAHMAFPPQQHGGGGVMPNGAGRGQQHAAPTPVYLRGPPMNLHPSYFLNHPAYYLPQHPHHQPGPPMLFHGGGGVGVGGLPPTFPPPRTATAFAQHTQPGGAPPIPLHLPPSAHSLQTRPSSLQTNMGAPFTGYHQE